MSERKLRIELVCVEEDGKPIGYVWDVAYKMKLYAGAASSLDAFIFALKELLEMGSKG